MTYEITDATKGNCSLCVSGKSAVKDVFVIKSPAYSGEICSKHLLVLVKKNVKHDASLLTDTTT